MLPTSLRALRQWAAPALLAALALSGLPGCGGSGFGTVTGHVLSRGKPLKAGQVSFLGADGVPVCGAIGPDGSYQVAHVPLGPAIVTVKSTPPKEPPKPPAKHTVHRDKDGRPVVDGGTKPNHPARPPAATPAKYADTRTTDLRLTVCQGLNRLDIELK